MSTKKYKDALAKIQKDDVENVALLEQNEIKENAVIEQYKKAAKNVQNAYKDSIATVDRQKVQAMQDANALNERLARYIPEMNQRAGIAGTGMAESTALKAYAAADAQRRGIATAYDTQKGSIMQDYAKAAAEMENAKAAAITEIDLANAGIVASAEAKKKTESEAKLANQKTNLAALGTGVQEGSVSLQDYLDYYNKMSASLDEDEDIALIQQYKDVMLDNVKRRERKNGKVFSYNGKYYRFTDNGKLVEVTAEEYKKSPSVAEIINQLEKSNGLNKEG